MSDNIYLKGVTELNALYSSGELSPSDLVSAVLTRIEKLNNKYNAFCFLDPVATMNDANASSKRWAKGEEKGLLDGIPFTSKDLILTKGWPTLRGSKTIDKGQVWSEDAPCIQRLREHGAILIGKTTTPEFGWKALTDSPLTGLTPNPWSLEHTAGGSSGGAAVAAELGMGVVHLGTDGGGSIRIPAAFCGGFGFKASAGRVPLYPPSPFGTLAHVGPLARKVSDVAAFLDVISEADNRDSFSLPYEKQNYKCSLNTNIEGLRIAYSPNLGYASVDNDIAQKVKKAVYVFEAHGAIVEQVDPGFTNPQEIFRKHWYVGAAYMLRNLNEEQRSCIDPGLLRIAAIGEQTSLNDYLEATHARAELSVFMRLFHEKYDLLVTPTMPTSAFAHKDEELVGLDGEGWDTISPFTYPFNLTGQPAASIPCGLNNKGLPISMQIIGRHLDDLSVLAAAAVYEKTCPENSVLLSNRLVI